MAKRTQDTVEDIVADPDALPDEPEELAEAEPAPQDYEMEFSPRAHDFASLEQIANAPSVQAARDAAHIPMHIPMKDLEGKAVIFVHKRKQKAALPDTGELREGYFCLCVNADTSEEFTTWVGQTILFRELTLLSMPFKTTIIKRGRTYMFQ